MDVYAGALCVMEIMEEEVYGERVVGAQEGRRQKPPVQDQGPQMLVPNDLHSSLQEYDRIYTGKEQSLEPFFGIRSAKTGQTKSSRQFPVGSVVPKTSPVPTPSIDMVQAKFSEALDKGCPSPVSPTTVENQNVRVHHQELAGCPVYPEQPNVSDKHLDLHGYVVPGTENEVNKLLNDLKDLSHGTHGVIVDTKTCQTSKGQYEEQEHFTVNKKLGQGANGTVDLCTDTTTREVFVRKTLPDKTCFSRREVDLLLGLKHKNIAQLKGFILREGKPEIYLEYGGLALNQLITDPGRYEQLVTDRNVALLAKQGLEALNYLNIYGILHLDVKPENICVKDVPNLELKLTDFGSCKASQDPLQFHGWTAEYMSPEACSLWLMHKMDPQAPVSKSLSGKTDVYAFGATIACMRYKQNPLKAVYMQNISLEQYMKKERIKIILQMVKHPDFMNELAQQIPTLTTCERVLLAKLLAGDANERYSAKEALQFVQEEMLPQFVPQNPQVRLLAPSAGVLEEAMSPQPACPTPCQPIEEVEIHMRAGKQRGPIQTVTPETTGADPMSRVAGQTGQAQVFEDMQTNQLINTVAPVLAVSISANDVSKDSSAIPTMAAPAGNVGRTGYKEVPAGNTPATPPGTLVSGKGSSKSGKGAMPGNQQQSLGKTVLKRNQSQRFHPYHSNNRFVVAPELPDFSQLM